MTLRVLVACEFSGKVRRAFRALGHEAWSCDLLPSDDNSVYHITGDVLTVLERKSSRWDLLIAHPPCTYMTNSGVCHLHKDTSRWPKLFEAARFFNTLMDAPIHRIAVENPIMHKYAKALIRDRHQDQVVQPWMFGHAEKKATCLWLKNLPPLVPTDNVKEQLNALPKSKAQRLHWLPPSKDRWKLRSETYQGIADAMASQWGSERQLKLAV
tara:strand:+ start:1402 stop:2037 length:636 start_codon:yes stop_codon:yes gene_type:complete